MDLFIMVDADLVKGSSPSGLRIMPSISHITSY